MEPSLFIYSLLSSLECFINLCSLSSHHYIVSLMRVEYSTMASTL